MSTQHHSLVMAALGLLLALAAAALHRPLARRTGWPRGATAGLLVSAALLLGFTLPDQLEPGSAHRLAACLADRSVRTLQGGAAHHAANVLLWLPLGLFGTLATRRPLLVTALASAAWAAVELVQTLDPVRSCQYLDWGNNTAGVLLGALLGRQLLRRRERA
ncbi:VanZ family protein [Kitasatospora sp. NPDC003701]